MLTMAAPSRMVTCTVGLEAFSFTGVRSCKQLSKSDFVQDTYLWWTGLVIMLEELIQITIAYLGGNVQPREK
jgi:hypothetical protein